jgi:hypothetical protein
MNFLYKTLIFLFFLFSNIYPQFYADSVVSDYVIEFMEFADEFAKQYDPERGVFKIFSDEEIKHIAELYFKCYNDNPLGFNQYVMEKHNEWARAPYELGMKSMQIRMRPWLKVYALRDQILNNYGVPFTAVIGTPALLRCKYLGLDFSDYYIISSLDTIFIKLHNFILLVEDVLKGNKFFKKGDTISVKMLPHVEKPSPEFKIGNIYLIPVRGEFDIQEGSLNNFLSYLVSSFHIPQMGTPPKTFPIIDEKITNCEYFGISDTNWTDFKIYFKETFLIFN